MDGAIGLFIGLLIDCIELCKTDEITFEITISGDNDFILGFSSKYDLTPFIQQFTIDRNDLPNYFPTVLKVVSEKFEIIKQEDLKTEICFSFDKEVISSTYIDYLKLSEKVCQVALLNRQCEILTIDKRPKYLTQNYYHFPQGVLYLFDRATTEVLGKPEFKIIIDERVSSYKLQIGLAYRTDWFPTPNIVSFANDVHTVCGGSLVDGVLDGLMSSCKKYVKLNNLTTFKVNRKKFINGLILICAVRGQDFKYGGSWKETVEDSYLRKEVKKLVSRLVLDFLKTEKERADKFLWRFDTTQLTSGMY